MTAPAATLLIDRIESPIGEVLIAVRDGSLVLLDFVQNDQRIDTLVRRHHPGAETMPVEDPAGVSGRLRRYFDDQLDALDDIAVDPGGTEFHRAVWLALRDIPIGTTTTYGALAARVGRPTASRAVGAANGANPISIVLPCHRVIGAKQRLTGYAGGLDRKRWLLRHEGATLA